MTTENENTVANLLEKRKEDFQPGKFKIRKEHSLQLENAFLKLELLRVQKHEIDQERQEVIAEITADLGIPDHMQISGGSVDFSEVSVDAKEVAE